MKKETALRLEKAKKYLSHRVWSPEQIAEHCGCTLASLRLVFSRHCGCSMTEYRERALGEKGLEPISYKLLKASRYLRLTDITLKEIAQKTGFKSVKALQDSFQNCYLTGCQTYRQNFGRRPLTSTRLMRAKEMVLTTNLSITKIAEAVGYDSVYPMASAFSARFGKSPRKYRKTSMPQIGKQI